MTKSKNTIEVKGIKIFKNGVHVWNAGHIYDLARWNAVFTKEEAYQVALEIAKKNYFNNFKWNKSFDWGTICTHKNGDKNFFPKNLKFKLIVDEKGNVMLYIQSKKITEDKSKTDSYGFVNHFTETKHRLGGEWREAIYIGMKNDRVSFL